jgi:hypothetical protein
MPHVQVDNVQMLNTRSLKWSDYIKPSAATLNDSVPVFRFSESRGSKYNHNTGEWHPARPTDEELVAYIRDYIGDPNLGTITLGDFIGHDYAEMQWKDRKHFFKAMEACLARGIGIMTQSRVCIAFGPSERDAIVPFTPETAEKIHWQYLCAEAAKYDWILSCCTAWPYTHTNSWLTDYGKRIVEMVKKYKGHWAPESDDEIALVDSVDDVEIKKDVVEAKQDDQEDEICYICLERKANTQVSPCNHQVVCSICSEGLKGTPDRNICVRCRRGITKVELLHQ